MKFDANSKESSRFGQVLAIAPFRSLWFGQIFSQLAQNALLFILALRVYQSTASNTAVSGLFFVYGIPAVLFGLIAGTIVDKLDRRNVLLFCDITRAILTVFLVFATRNIFMIYAVTLINAMINQFYVPAEGPTIPTLVPSALLVTANSLFSFTYFTSLAVGSILAGPFLRLFGPFWIFFVMGGFFLLAAWNVSHIPVGESGDQTIPARLKGMTVGYIVSRIVANIREGISYVQASPVLADALLLLTGTQIILAILGTLGPGFADTVLHIDIHDASVLITGPVVVGIVLGALWVGNFGRRVGTTRLIAIGVMGAGVLLLATALLTFFASWEILAPLFDGRGIVILASMLFFFLGVANSFLDVPANSILQEETQGTMRSRIYGMLGAAVGGVGVLPVVIGGIMADIVGIGNVLAILGLGILVYGIVRTRRTIPDTV